MSALPKPWRLCLLSFLMLFVELALIRWIGAMVIYLSYFSNFVLLASFLGIGLGFLRARASHNGFSLAPVLLAGMVAFVIVFPVQINRSGSNLIFFGALENSGTGLPIWATLPVIFVAVAAVMMSIAEGVARTFAQLDPLRAYQLDIIGSIAGIAVFSLLSFVGTPPIAWGLIVVIAFVVLYLPSVKRVQLVALVALALMLAIQSLTPLESWSPYYRVTLRPQPSGPVTVLVNGIPHQTIDSIEQRRTSVPLYFLPYQQIRTPPRRVLIVGAGAGTDAAIALAQKVEHVDAVEIDPTLQSLGVRLNPNHPYQDPRVTVHIDDGRAFLQQTDQHYDLILFALPDSLTLISGQSSLRLESYLFTAEAMRAARDHLNPGGVFAEYNYYRDQWLIDRLAGTLQAVYGHAPCLISTGQYGRLALLSASVEPSSIQCPTRWSPALRTVPAAATDDYPFLYLQQRGIPGFYLLTLALILVVAVAMVRLAGGPMRGMLAYGDLFLMGVAFLLLETKNVVQFALLFGTTWFVNALVFTGILLAVLAAVTVAQRVRVRALRPLYALLIAALALAWLVPPESLLGFPLLLRLITATLLAFIPIFLANLLFAERFKDVASSTVAFGANLLGAMIGGMLEYGALITGYRALLPLMAALYLVAALLNLRTRGAGVAV